MGRPGGSGQAGAPARINSSKEQQEEADERCHPAANSEAQTAPEVAACTLILNDEGLMGYSGHVSARLPGEDAYLVQPIDTSRAA